jgi:xanthine dehydrogenase large subunit
MNKPTELQPMLARPETGAAAMGAAGEASPHESAHLHVAGEAVYVDDMTELAGTLHAALGLSERAHARIRAIDLDGVRASPGVVAVLTARDIPGDNDCGPIVHDDPVLADGVVSYAGQPVFAVLAESHELARRAARRAAIDYEPLDPQLDPREAARCGSFVVPPLHLARGDPDAALAAAPLRLRGSFRVGGQEQFYLEGQIAYAAPREDGCLAIWCSTQHPTEMQHVVARLLGLASNQVTVEMRRMGGGFGGKESQSALFCCVAALGARLTGRPVKLRPDRDDDFLITGKRHGFDYTYDVGYDDDGTILAATVEMISHAGFSADLSGPVATRALCHFDNAYFLPAVDIRVLSARTNTQSNTAFRGFGGPQGAIAIEVIVDDIARALGRDPVDVRRRNFYGKGSRNVTPYGQVVEDNVIDALTTRLLLSSDYRDRRAAARDFNDASPVLKKGIALTPVKFGISFNVAHYNQAGALVHVYTDGTVLVNHGGTEMGQGLNTKVAQVVAAELGVPLAKVRATAADTSKVPNTSATAASTGSDLNGKAAEDAARTIRQRLARFAVQTWGGAAEEVVFAQDTVRVNGQVLPFAELVTRAYEARVQLWSDGFYATPKLHWDRVALTGRPFFYFAYGAAVSEVVVDTLTGEWKLVRADLLHDTGRSINPAIDLGQVEGAFIQGMGWLTSEELFWNAEGRLMTFSPSTYKIPAVNDCPPDLRVQLFDDGNVEDTVFRSKAVGEPPLLLAFSVFLAIRDAIAGAAGYRHDPPLNAPATPESIMRALLAVREMARAQNSAETPHAP